MKTFTLILCAILLGSFCFALDQDEAKQPKQQWSWTPEDQQERELPYYTYYYDYTQKIRCDGMAICARHGLSKAWAGRD